MEPLCYPLLFSRGELGWGCTCHDITLVDYIASRLLRAEKEYNIVAPSLLYPEHKLPTNRFQMMASRLGQTWLVDMISRMIDRKLNFVMYYHHKRLPKRHNHDWKKAFE